MSRRRQTARTLIEGRVAGVFAELAALADDMGYGPDTVCQHSIVRMRGQFEARAERAINEIESGSRKL